MITYQEFITEIKRYRLRRSGGDPFTRYSDGKQKPIDLSAIHAAGSADAKASVGYREKREKEYRRQDTRRRMDAAGKKLGLPEEVELDEILMITPATKKTTTKSQSKQTKDPYGEDPAVTRKRLATKVKKLKEEDEIEEGIGMTVASALGNPPPLSKRMKLKQALIIGKIKSDSEKNKKKKYSGKAASEENVQELFITRKSPEERADAKRKKKVETLIRLMQHAKDPAADVAKTKKEDYELGEAIKGLRPASERTKNAITPAQRRAQELARKRKEELAHKADLALAGMKKTAKPGAVTQTSSKPEAPEANRKLKTGKKVDTLAVRAKKVITTD